MAETTALDDKAWQLLQALQHDGRAPLKQLAEAAGLSIPATAERLKRLKDVGAVSHIAAQLDAELKAFARGTETGDFKEGIAAFLAKRKPQFTGR